VTLPLPETCPRFQTCGAAICPLAPEEGYHRNAEPVCFYLRCTGKKGAEEYFAQRVDEEATFKACKQALPGIAARYPDIANKVKAAAKSGIKGSKRQGFLGDQADAGEPLLCGKGEGDPQPA
jgi:hypothetical protein